MRYQKWVRTRTEKGSKMKLKAAKESKTQDYQMKRIFLMHCNRIEVNLIAQKHQTDTRGQNYNTLYILPLEYISKRSFDNFQNPRRVVFTVLHFLFLSTTF